jgi:DNA ligase (NAD+)
VRCVSRGDGETGEDVTQQLVGAIGIPARLSGVPQEYPRILEVRGEVFISDHDFEAVNRARDTAGMRRFKNSRNAAAGAMRRLEPQAGNGTDAGPLRFMVYSWGEVVCSAEQGWRSQSSFLSCVRRFGLIPVPLLAVSDALEDVMREQEFLCDAESKGKVSQSVRGSSWSARETSYHTSLD